MGKNIEVKDARRYEKNSYFNAKTFKIGNVDVDRPIKTVDISRVTKNVFEANKKNFAQLVISYSVGVKPRTIRSILNERDDSKINKIFGFRTFSSEHPYLISSTLKFNPYTEFGKLENISGYLSYYREFSDVIFVPNVKIDKYVPIASGKTVKKNIMTTEDYKKFVNEAYQILDRRNSKKIFVPVSLRMGINDVKTLAAEYAKNDWLDIWFDFEGSAIRRSKIARVKAFLDMFEDKGVLRQAVIYSTNIKRELISNKEKPHSPASDVLATLAGSNLVGANKEPNAFWKDPSGEPRPPLTPEERQKLREHKSRLFNSSTYYYDKHLPIMGICDNTVTNSIRLDNEFACQTQHFDETHQIRDYIEEKPIFDEYGKILKEFFVSKHKKLVDWF